MTSRAAVIVVQERAGSVTDRRVAVAEERETTPNALARRLLVSCTCSTIIFAATLTLTLGDLLSGCRVLHPLFWLPIAIGALGVAGGTYIRLASLWRG